MKHRRLDGFSYVDGVGLRGHGFRVSGSSLGQGRQAQDLPVAHVGGPLVREGVSRPASVLPCCLQPPLGVPRARPPSRLPGRDEAVAELGDESEAERPPRFRDLGRTGVAEVLQVPDALVCARVVVDLQRFALGLLLLFEHGGLQAVLLRTDLGPHEAPLQLSIVGHKRKGPPGGLVVELALLSDQIRLRHYFMGSIEGHVDAAGGPAESKPDFPANVVREPRPAHPDEAVEHPVDGNGPLPAAVDGVVVVVGRVVLQRGAEGAALDALAEAKLAAFVGVPEHRHQVGCRQLLVRDNAERVRLHEGDPAQLVIELHGRGHQVHCAPDAAPGVKRVEGELIGSFLQMK